MITGSQVPLDARQKRFTALVDIWLKKKIGEMRINSPCGQHRVTVGNCCSVRGEKIYVAGNGNGDVKGVN